MSTLVGECRFARRGSRIACSDCSRATASFRAGSGTAHKARASALQFLARSIADSIIHGASPLAWFALPEGTVRRAARTRRLQPHLPRAR